MPSMVEQRTPVRAGCVSNGPPRIPVPSELDRCESAIDVQARLLAVLRQIDPGASVTGLCIGGFTGTLHLHLPVLDVAAALAERFTLAPAPTARSAAASAWSGVVDGVQVWLAVLGAGGR